MLRRLPAADLSGVTRAIARPHGWIFQIPLQGSISCGYIFNRNISPDAQVDDDFTSFLQSEGVSSWTPRGTLNFPNFVRRRVFDGRVFWSGNAASFIEPLEATTIGHAIVQARSATRWIVEEGRGRCADPDEVEAFNGAMLSYVCCDSLFVAWHYACGSRWGTPFWQYARRGIERARNNPLARAHLVHMEEFIEAGRALPGLALSECKDQDQWERDFYPLLRLYRPFGNFSELNFAQVGHGIGYYGASAGREQPGCHRVGDQ